MALVNTSAALQIFTLLSLISFCFYLLQSCYFNNCYVLKFAWNAQFFLILYNNKLRKGWGGMHVTYPAQTIHTSLKILGFMFMFKFFSLTSWYIWVFYILDNFSLCRILSRVYQMWKNCCYILSCPLDLHQKMCSDSKSL